MEKGDESIGSVPTVCTQIILTSINICNPKQQKTVHTRPCMDITPIALFPFAFQSNQKHTQPN